MAKLIASVGGQPLVSGEWLPECASSFGGREPIFVSRVREGPGWDRHVRRLLPDNGKQDFMVHGDDGRDYVVQSRLLKKADGSFPALGERFELRNGTSAEPVVAGKVTFVDQEKSLLDLAWWFGKGGGAIGVLTGVAKLLGVSGAAGPAGVGAMAVATVACCIGLAIGIKDIQRTEENGEPGKILHYTDQTRLTKSA